MPCIANNDQQGPSSSDGDIEALRVFQEADCIRKVATHQGNYDHVSLRALETVNSGYNEAHVTRTPLRRSPLNVSFQHGNLRIVHAEQSNVDLPATFQYATC